MKKLIFQQPYIKCILPSQQEVRNMLYCSQRGLTSKEQFFSLLPFFSFLRLPQTYFI